MKNSAERYFKIPHIEFRVGPSSLFILILFIFNFHLLFLFLISCNFIFTLLISLSFFFSKNLILFLVFILFVYFCPKVVQVQGETVVTRSSHPIQPSQPHPQHEFRNKLSHLNPKCRFSATNTWPKSQSFPINTCKTDRKRTKICTA